MWGQLVIDSVLRPRVAARHLLAMPLPGAAIVQAAVLVSCAGTMLVYLGAQAIPALAGSEIASLSNSPLLASLLNVLQIFVMAGVAARVGRLFGGTGTLSGAIALVTWYNLVSMILVAVLLLAFLLSAPLAFVLGIAFCFWLVWAPTVFLSELHGFASALVVFAGLLVTLLALYLALNVVAMLLSGLSPEMG